jgi:hypothetical protein
MEILALIAQTVAGYLAYWIITRSPTLTQHPVKLSMLCAIVLYFVSPLALICAVAFICLHGWIEHNQQAWNK